MANTVLVAEADGVATLTLNRPEKRNAISFELLEDLMAALDAAEKILAAYDAGARRFDCALGGLGGCPFAQDLLVGNIPTERVLEALGGRGIPLPLKKPLDSVLRMSADIAQKHFTQVVH